MELAAFAKLWDHFGGQKHTKTLFMNIFRSLKVVRRCCLGLLLIPFLLAPSTCQRNASLCGPAARLQCGEKEGHGMVKTKPFD